MDQLATIWAGLPEVGKELILRARAFPDLALYALAVPLLIALASRSLAGIALAAAILWIPAALLLTGPADDRSWLILWTACAASLLATAIAYHRRRLAKEARVLSISATAMKKELGDLRTSYEHVIRGAGNG
jgi:hypothetical protein